LAITITDNSTYEDGKNVSEWKVYNKAGVLRQMKEGEEVRRASYRMDANG
jgi:hypothetical protein